MTHRVRDTAARVGLPSRTLRYYDRIGLVCPPRTASGYRAYGPEEEGRLRFVVAFRAGGASGCGRSGHDAFCGCLSDAAPRPARREAPPRS